ncbi:hypothetical protein VTO42DRAFT_3777 [Malbranchea cinnamomea]
MPRLILSAFPPNSTTFAVIQSIILLFFFFFSFAPVCHSLIKRLVRYQTPSLNPSTGKKILDRWAYPWPRPLRSNFPLSMTSSTGPSTAPAGASGRKPYTVPPEAQAVFQSNRWTASLLASPHYTAVEIASRTSKPTGEDAYIADTLGTAATVPHLVALRKNNLTPAPTSPPSIPDPPARAPTPQASPEIIVLAQLGNPGIAGHPHTAHGGVISTLFDEVMSLAVAAQVPGYDLNQAQERGRIYTSRLDVRYFRPVYVPAPCVVKAWVLARSGRKFWTMAQIIQEDGLWEGDSEDRGGSVEAVRKKVVCAEALAFWVQKKPEKL